MHRQPRQHRDWLVVGISGVTCGGKTTLSNKLIDTIYDSFVLHQDKYFLGDDDPRHVRVPNLVPPHNNYDILNALDMEQMVKDASAILSGSLSLAHAHHSCEGPGSGGGGGGGGRHASCCRRVLPDTRLLILEGFTALNYKPLFDMCDVRFYFILEIGECFSRRAHRLYDPPDVAGYFEQCVWPEHLRHRAELENRPEVTIIDGAQKFEEIYESVMDKLRAML